MKDAADSPTELERFLYNVGIAPRRVEELMEGYRAALREPGQIATISPSAVENPLSRIVERMNPQDTMTPALLALRSEIRAQNLFIFNQLRKTKRHIYCLFIIQTITLILVLGVFISA